MKKLFLLAALASCLALAGCQSMGGGGGGRGGYIKDPASQSPVSYVHQDAARHPGLASRPAPSQNKG